jgi:predicted metal-dependent hydrolase
VADAIRIGDPAIEVRLRRNARARRLVLRVAQGGRGPILTLPPGVPLAHARAFLTDHEGWLRRNLGAAGLRATTIGEGTLVPFGDGSLTVRSGGGPIGRAGDVLSVGGTPARIGPRAAAWLREEARRACVDGVGRHAGRLGLQPGRISLRDPRSRWGSCTAAGDLMFSWRLAMAPVAVLDYVVAHEVAHLAEMNHSPRCWAVVRRLCPEIDAPRAWLRQNGGRLHGYDFGTTAA